MANNNFVVKNGLTVNGSFTANSTVVNAAAITAQSANIASLFTGGVSVNTMISSNAATAFSNAVANAANFTATTAATAYSNATSFATTAAATAFANAVANAANFTATTAAAAYSNAISIASSATNLTSGTVPAARLSGSYGINISGTAQNSNTLEGQGSGFYTNIPARLGYTPANRAGDTFTSDVTTNGSLRSQLSGGATGQVVLGNGSYRLYHNGSGTFDFNGILTAGNFYSSGTLTAGNFYSSGSEIRVGDGSAGEKTMKFWNSARVVYYYLGNSGELGLWDGSGNFNRWSTDTSGNFTAAGNITAYSDIKLKTNVYTIIDALSKVKKLRGVSYQRISDNSLNIGMIAQEVQEVIPEVVIKNSEDTLSVAYGNLVGVLIEAIKELSAKVEELEKRI